MPSPLPEYHHTSYKLFNGYALYLVRFMKTGTMSFLLTQFLPFIERLVVTYANTILQGRDQTTLKNTWELDSWEKNKSAIPLSRLVCMARYTFHCYLASMENQDPSWQESQFYTIEFRPLAKESVRPGFTFCFSLYRWPDFCHIVFDFPPTQGGNKDKSMPTGLWRINVTPFMFL